MRSSMRKQKSKRIKPRKSGNMSFKIKEFEKTARVAMKIHSEKAQSYQITKQLMGGRYHSQILMNIMKINQGVLD
jgi:hypothetical protein